MKKGVDERGMECYIKTVAPMRAARNSKGPCRLMRCRMYPENYTMQNMLDNESNKPDATSLMSVNETTILLQE